MLLGYGALMFLESNYSHRLMVSCSAVRYWVHLLFSTYTWAPCLLQGHWAFTEHVGGVIGVIEYVEHDGEVR